ncbi:hypothetical protein LJR074_002577 [Acidovorax sp. LjRoot74]|uniref:hypothetical protein n=1 Tax=Acidovorax sp. LjRoot74 TaxID=3342337 RepID=UPI003ED0C856
MQTTTQPAAGNINIEALLKLAHRVEHLNPAAETIGPGMLASLVEDAKKALSFTANIPAVAHDTMRAFADAFTLWEENYRTDPTAFMTAEECRAAATAEHGERCAIYFTAMLRQARGAA